MRKVWGASAALLLLACQGAKPAVQTTGHAGRDAGSDAASATAGTGASGAAAGITGAAAGTAAAGSNGAAGDGADAAAGITGAAGATPCPNASADAAADAAPEAAPSTAACSGHVAGDLVCTGAEIRRCAADLASAPVVTAPCSGQTPLCMGGACVACGDPARCECGGFPMPSKATYVINQDGTVTDDVTGLVWERTVSATGAPKPAVPGCSSGFPQDAAAAYCAGKGSTWRLPTRIELISLVDYYIGRPGPAIDTITFPDTPAVGFWTSTPSKRSPGSAWFFDFGAVQAGTAPVGPDGNVTGNFRVRCVRSGATRCFTERFAVHPDAGNVTDLATGLTWDTFGPVGALSWSDAGARCAAQGAKWRLPTVAEALSLVDDTRADPALDTNLFPGPYRSAATPTGRDTAIWTSTNVPRDSIGRRWLVDFSDGTPRPEDAALTHSARCVRTFP